MFWPQLLIECHRGLRKFHFLPAVMFAQKSSSRPGYASERVIRRGMYYLFLSLFRGGSLVSLGAVSF